MSDEKKSKQEALARDLSGSLIVYMTVILIFEILIAGLNLTLRMPMWPCSLIFALGSFIFLTLTKQYSDRETVKKGYRILVFTVAISAWEILSSICLSSPVKTLRIVALLAFPVFMLFAAMMSYSRDSADIMNRYIEMDPFTKKEDKTKGMIIIGEEIDKDTHQPTGKTIGIPYKDRFVHMIIYGPTGSGKTSQTLIPMALQDIKNPEVGIIVLEPKGDFAQEVYAHALLNGRTNAIYFDPEFPDCPYFNPLKGAEEDVIENLVTAFGAMDTGANTYFRDNNETLLRNSVKVVKRLFKDDATMDQVYVVMSNLNGQGKIWLKQLAEGAFDPVTANDNNTVISYFNNDYYTGIGGERKATKTYQDSSAIRTQITKMLSNPYLHRILNPPKTSELKKGTYIDFDQVLAEGSVLCMSSAQGKLRDLGSYLGYFLILTLESSVMRRPGNENTRRGCIFYADEFQKYANNGFADMLTQGRSYRVASVLATQNRTLIEGSGGHQGRQFLENVSTNARNIIVLPGCSSNDAKYFSAEFGDHEVEVVREGMTRAAYVPSLFSWNTAKETRNVEVKDMPRFSPTDLQYRPFGEVVCKVVNNNTVQYPTTVKVSFIPREAKNAAMDLIDDMKAGRGRFKRPDKIEDNPFVPSKDDADRLIDLGLAEEHDDDDFVIDMTEPITETSSESSDNEDGGDKPKEIPDRNERTSPKLPSGITVNAGAAKNKDKPKGSSGGVLPPLVEDEPF